MPEAGSRPGAAHVEAPGGSPPCTIRCLMHARWLQGAGNGEETHLPQHRDAIARSGQSSSVRVSGKPLVRGAG
jgi:hypothetical protein